MRAMGLWFCFILFSTLQVRFVDASSYSIPAEDPEDCVKNKSIPCSLNTGDKPRMFPWDDSLWELDRNLVLHKQKEGKTWNLYKGLLVVNAQDDVKIHTPFADLNFQKSKVMVHVLEDRVRVLCLEGRGVLVKPKAGQMDHYLVPGFQNWFGGNGQGDEASGVVSVIDFDQYAKQRAKFFLDHQMGFSKELENVAKVVKWAARLASKINRDLIERKFASLEEEHQEKINKTRRQIQFNKYLRRLFLEKIRYDY